MTEGIHPHVMGRHLAGVDRDTGEITDGPDRRNTTGRDDASARPWPPPSRGPLPPGDSLPPDLNIYTAQDEIDAWAHEHDAATERLAALRAELNRGTDTEDAVEIQYLRARSKARRVARASPTERGRRTAADIDGEVEEALIASGILARRLDLESSIEIALGRLFRAKDNVNRLENYIRSLPRVSDGNRHG